ncbi:hypothetical protein CI789_02515 [Erwinia persicina]|uniref:hypothetical protein n=1 Tax=Erwinia persicina TaxID=55211 RepID=UPI000E51C89D|nr:hypothetical protein [Erwinia persicina]AXU94200.1 hypothetical protein CI789_02515 [Erwinia persicina]
MSDVELFNHAKRVIENGGELERETCRSLIEWLEEAERERDELRAEQAEHDEQIARMEGKFSLAKRALDSKAARCDRAEAELARRDAAAGEPVAWISERNLKILGKAFSVVVKHEPVMVRPVALYTAAPTAVLLQSDIDRIVPAIDPDGLDEAKHYIEHALYVDRERIRSELKELGAQPQKPVAEVEELSMQIRRLVHSLKNFNPDSSLLKSVPDYMQRKGYWKATDCLRGEHD